MDELTNEYRSDALRSARNITDYLLSGDYERAHTEAGRLLGTMDLLWASTLGDREKLKKATA